MNSETALPWRAEKYALECGRRPARRVGRGGRQQGHTDAHGGRRRSGHQGFSLAEPQGFHWRSMLLGERKTFPLRLGLGALVLLVWGCRVALFLLGSTMELTDAGLDGSPPFGVSGRRGRAGKPPPQAFPAPVQPRFPVLIFTPS